MKLPFKELVQLSKEHDQIWPADLVEGLEDSEPQVSWQGETYSQLILEHKRAQKEKNKPSPLPSLVVAGWDNPGIKGTKNWADFENLILFYTIGELDIANAPENIQQKEQDLGELRQAIESFLPLNGQKSKSAEERVAVNTTYLAFGKRVIDSLVKDDPCAKYEIQREMKEAEETNYFNATKLEKSYGIASRVFKNLQKRYRQR